MISTRAAIWARSRYSGSRCSRSPSWSSSSPIASRSSAAPPPRASSNEESLLRGQSPERAFDARLDLADHQLHRAHRGLVRRVPDLERKAHMHRAGGLDLGEELLGHGLDIADQEVVADLFERRLVRKRLVDQLR